MSPTKLIGPSDKRRQKSRCKTCAGRRIKCQGGFPCAYCMRIGAACFPPTQNTETGLLVVQTYIPPGTGKTQPIRLPQDIPLDLPTKLAKHFFSVFIMAHDFVGNQHLDVGTIAKFCQTNSALQSATVAIASLDASRRSQTLSYEEKGLACTSALKAYRMSLLTFGKDLSQKDTMSSDNDSYLWTTFFLGIFELMYDVTGDGWIKHIQYGTSKLLRLRGPSVPLSDSFRQFFLSVRVYEICRALIFNEHTFLDESGWKDLMLWIWENDNSDWHPKEDILDLMISCTSLSTSVIALHHKDSQPSVEILCSLANEGLQIQASLCRWKTISASWEASFKQKHEISSGASNSIIAKVYYHATNIYLSGIFDYPPYWTESEMHIHVPTLHQAEVQQHVSAILETTRSALKETNLVGLIFFFPLRVAGARARTPEQKLQIIELLRGISRRNFIVAGAFVEDLEHLWGNS